MIVSAIHSDVECYVEFKSELEIRYLERAISREVSLRGRDGVPRTMVKLLDALSRHSPPLAANSLDVDEIDMQGATMTYKQAALRLGIKPRTLSRRIAVHKIQPVGRRLRVVDVAALDAVS